MILLPEAKYVEPVIFGGGGSLYELFLGKIQLIAEFLAKSPHPDQALDFLTAHISPDQELSVSYRGVVEDDGSIKCLNLHGFSKYQHMSETTLKISENRPMSNASRTQKLVWARVQTVKEEFSDFYHFDSMSDWESMLAIPVGLSRIYSFSFKTDLTQIPGIDNYFEAIRSLLLVYESSLEIRTLSSSKDLLASSELQPLTQRQEKILELLRAGKTNKSIANEIGYSESLVRHETMIIYKKMRVEGRHELRESV